MWHGQNTSGWIIYQMYAKEPLDEAGRLHSRCREFAYSGSQLAFPGLPKQAIRTPRHAAHRGRARPGLVANFGSIFEGLTRPGAGEELAGPRRSVRGCLPLSVVWNMRRRVDETHAELGSAACRLRNPRRRREGPGPRKNGRGRREYQSGGPRACSPLQWSRCSPQAVPGLLAIAEACPDRKPITAGGLKDSRPLWGRYCTGPRAGDARPAQSRAAE